MSNSDFEKAMGGVQPLQTPSRARNKPSDLRSIDKSHRRPQAEHFNEGEVQDQLSDHNVRLLQPDDFVEWKLDGIQPGVFAHFQAGKYYIEARLDLHRVRINQARDLVAKLIQRCIDSDIRCALISHGRGLKGKPQAQMKSHVVHWLRQHENVIAYSTAPSNLGGTGAVLVKIRKSHKAKLENRERFQR